MSESTDYISRLLHKQLTVCGYAGSTRTFGFGPYSEVTGVRGNTRYHTDIGVHVQCAWRMILDGVVRVGSADWWHPSVDSIPTVDEDWDPVTGGSEQDMALRQLFGDWPTDRKVLLNQRGGLFVTQVTISGANDLMIQLDKNCTLEIFVDGRQGEHWRILDSQIDKHLVCKDNCLRRL